MISSGSTYKATIDLTSESPKNTGKNEVVFGQKIFDKPKSSKSTHITATKALDASSVRRLDKSAIKRKIMYCLDVDAASGVMNLGNQKFVLDDTLKKALKTNGSVVLFVNKSQAKGGTTSESIIPTLKPLKSPDCVGKISREVPQLNIPKTMPPLAKLTSMSTKKSQNGSPANHAPNMFQSQCHKSGTISRNSTTQTLMSCKNPQMESSVSNTLLEKCQVQISDISADAREDDSSLQKILKSATPQSMINECKKKVTLSQNLKSAHQAEISKISCEKSSGRNKHSSKVILLNKPKQNFEYQDSYESFADLVPIPPSNLLLHFPTSEKKNDSKNITSHIRDPSPKVLPKSSFPSTPELLPKSTTLHETTSETSKSKVQKSELNSKFLMSSTSKTSAEAHNSNISRDSKSITKSSNSVLSPPWTITRNSSSSIPTSNSKILAKENAPQEIILSNTSFSKSNVVLISNTKTSNNDGKDITHTKNLPLPETRLPASKPAADKALKQARNVSEPPLVLLKKFATQDFTELSNNVCNSEIATSPRVSLVSQVAEKIFSSSPQKTFPSPSSSHSELNNESTQLQSSHIANNSNITDVDCGDPLNCQQEVGLAQIATPGFVIPVDINKILRKNARQIAPRCISAKASSKIYQKGFSPAEQVSSTCFLELQQIIKSDEESIAEKTKSICGSEMDHRSASLTIVPENTFQITEEIQSEESDELLDDLIVAEDNGHEETHMSFSDFFSNINGKLSEKPVRKHSKSTLYTKQLKAIELIRRGLEIIKSFQNNSSNIMPSMNDADYHDLGVRRSPTHSILVKRRSQFRPQEKSVKLGRLENKKSTKFKDISKEKRPVKVLKQQETVAINGEYRGSKRKRETSNDKKRLNAKLTNNRFEDIGGKAKKFQALSTSEKAFGKKMPSELIVHDFARPEIQIQKNVHSSTSFIDDEFVLVKKVDILTSKFKPRKDREQVARKKR